MSKKIKKIKKYYVEMTIILVLVFLGIKFYEKTGYIVLSFILSIFVGILIVHWILDVVDKALEIRNQQFASKASTLWNDVKKNARPNLIHYIDKNSDNIYNPPLIFFGQLIMAYHNDATVFDKLLEKIVKIYISNDSTHCILSYILLDNCDKNQVAIFFEANPDLKKQCEIISKELAHSQVKAFYRGSVELNENLVLALLHACLPNNSILEEINYLLRLVISSVLSNIVDKDIDEYDEVILKLILMLPLIKERIGKINTIDEKIIKNIENIENSKELKQLVNKSYQYIEQCFEEDLSLAQFNSFVMYTCVLCTYYDKMSESIQNKLYKKIKDRNQLLSKYFEKDDKKIILFVLAALPLKMFKSEGDMIYQLELLAYLCATKVILS